MRAFELLEVQQTYYHGSYEELPVGTILLPGQDMYEFSWSDTDFYAALEYYRPNNMLAHKEAVFMVDNDNDLDVAGGSTDYVFMLEPLGKVEKHDLNWGSEISMLVGEGYDIKSKEVARAATNYWAGTPHTNESVWEYLTPRAKILHVEEF